MLKSIYKVSGFVAVMAWSGMVSATGLGGINVASSLGQALKAEIELVSVDKADRESISARLASPEAFKSAGVDYPYNLPKLKFEIINRDSGNPSVKVSTSQPVNDPFVILLVELTWSSGRLLREYTFLLDPVDFKALEPQVTSVQPIAPVVVAPVASAPVAELPPQISMPVQTPVAQVTPTPVETVSAEPTRPERTAEPTRPERTAAVPAPLEKAVPKRVAPPKRPPVADALGKEEALSGAKSVKVVRGDSLSKIALEYKPADVSLERMLVALYRANTDAFVGQNMNRLKTGKIIRLPDANDLDVIEHTEAIKEVRAQVADWNAYRQQLAAVKVPVREDAAKQVASGKINTAVADSAAGKTPAKEVLKLSKGDAPGDQAAAGGRTSAQNKAMAKEEEAVAASKALKEAQERTALLEKNVKDLQRLAELKKQAADTTLAGAASAPVAAASAAVAVTPKVVVPKPEVVASNPEVVAETSILQYPLILAAGAAGLLALGGVGFMLVRRNKKSGGKLKERDESVEEEVGAATGRIATPVMPSPDTGDFTQSAFAESGQTMDAEEVDPIGEADLFLTFGRDVQAEEVLTEALNSNPNNIQVRLKLLSIYATRKDTNAFFTHAKAIKDSGNEAAWSQAAAMGQALEPSNPLYGGDGGATLAATQKTTETHQPSVDFDLGFDSQATAVQSPNDFQGTVVLEKTSKESTAILSSSDLRAAQEIPMDFDVTSTHPRLTAFETQSLAPTGKLDEMVFDLTTSHSEVPAQNADKQVAAPQTSHTDDLIFDVTTSQIGAPSLEKPAAPADDDSLAFTLDFPTDFITPTSTKEPVPIDIGLGDISLDLGDFSAATTVLTPNDSKDERWQEVATKLDLAKAYQEMGDAAGAKEILEEVLRDGDEEQRATAEAMMQQL